MARALTRACDHDCGYARPRSVATITSAVFWSSDPRQCARCSAHANEVITGFEPTRAARPSRRRRAEPADSIRRVRLRERVEPWVEPVLVPVGFVAASAIAHLLVAWTQNKTLSSPVPTVHLLAKWDGGIYLQLALHGYPSKIPMRNGHYLGSTLGFYPLYPLVVRAVYTLSPWNILTSGLIVALTFTVAATLTFWQLTARLVDRSVANRSVALLLFAPGAVVLSMTYSEPLFLLLACGCLWALGERRWVLAGSSAFLACIARPNGIALVAACAVAAVIAIRRQREWRALSAPLLSVAGLAVLPIYDRFHTGDALAYWRTQHDAWSQGFDFGAHTLRSIGKVLAHPTHDFNLLMSVLAILVIAVGLVLMAYWKPPAEVFAYTIVIVLLALTSTTLTSTFRFEMTAFPLTIAYGRVLRKEAFTAAIALSVVLFAMAAAGAVTVLYTP